MFHPIYEKLASICKQKKISITSLCEKITGSTGNLATWKKGKIYTDDLAKIQRELSIPIDCLFEQQKLSKIPIIAEPFKVYPTRQLIAFVDILGTKEMSKENSLLFANLLNEVYDNFRFNLESNNVASSIRFKCFSDNITFSCSYSEQTCIQEISNMITLLANYQIDLVRHGVLCRGCLSLGNIYIDNTFLIGDGLIDAYTIENEIAIYPRIIISNDVFNIIKHHLVNGQSTNVIIQDFDNKYFINFLSFAKKIDFVYINELIRKTLNCTRREDVVYKYLWLKNYAKNAIKDSNQSFTDFCNEHTDDINTLLQKCEKKNNIAKTTTNALSTELAELAQDERFVDCAKLYKELKQPEKREIYAYIVGLASGILGAVKVNKILGR